MELVNAKTAQFVQVEILGIPALYHFRRLDQDTIPAGMYAYEMRESETDWSQPSLLARHIPEGHFGTVLTASPIDLDPDGRRELDPGDFFEGHDAPVLTVAEFERKFLAPGGQPPRRCFSHTPTR